MTQNVIAIDAGRSAIKVAAGPTPFLITSAVYPAQEISVEDSAASAKEDTVTLGEEEFFIGETAMLHSGGRVDEGLRDDWAETKDHLALLKGAYLKAKKRTGNPGDVVVLGLPSKLHLQQKQRLNELAALTLGLPQEKVVVVPQPLGAFMSVMLDADGAPMPGKDPTKENWGVIDVGYYTTDYGIMGHGKWSTAGQHSSEGTSKAAQMVADRLSKYGVTLRQAEEILRSKSFRHLGQVIDAEKDVDTAANEIAGNIISMASQVFGSSLNSFNGILLVGGGAELVMKTIKKKWPHTFTPEAPRFAVAEGMRRYGLLITAAAAAKA